MPSSAIAIRVVSYLSTLSVHGFSRKQLQISYINMLRLPLYLTYIHICKLYPFIMYLQPRLCSVLFASAVFYCCFLSCCNAGWQSSEWISQILGKWSIDLFWGCSLLPFITAKIKCFKRSIFPITLLTETIKSILNYTIIYLFYRCQENKCFHVADVN